MPKTDTAEGRILSFLNKIWPSLYTGNRSPYEPTDVRGGHSTSTWKFRCVSSIKVDWSWMAEPSCSEARPAACRIARGGAWGQWWAMAGSSGFQKCRGLVSLSVRCMAKIEDTLPASHGESNLESLEDCFSLLQSGKVRFQLSWCFTSEWYLMYKESACLTMNEASPLSSISGFCFFFFTPVLGQPTKLFRIKQNQVRTKFKAEQWNSWLFYHERSKGKFPRRHYINCGLEYKKQEISLF